MKKYAFILFLLWPVCIAGQHPYYYHYTTDDELPSNEVYEVVQDKNGKLWIGSDAGLFSYDGLYFQSYTSSKQGSRALSSLKFDRQGNLWCRNFTGQIFYINEHDSMIMFKDIPQQAGYVCDFAHDHKNKIWITERKFIRVIDIISGKEKIIRKTDSAGNEILWSTVENDGSGNIYCAASDGSMWIAPKGDIDQFHFTLPTPGKIVIRRIKKTSAGTFVIAVEDNVKFSLYLIKQTGYIHCISAGQKNHLPFIYDIEVAANKGFWVSTSEGVWLLDSAFQRVSNYPVLFPNDKISSVFIDRENTIWFTSLQNGIFAIPNPQLLVVNKDNSTLYEDNLTAIEMYNGEIYAGGYGGQLISIHPSTLHIRTVTGNPKASYITVKHMLRHQNKLLVSRGPISVYSGQTHTDDWPYMNARSICMDGEELHVVSFEAWYKVKDFSHPERSKMIMIINNGGRSLTTDTIHHKVYAALITGLYVLHHNKVTEIKWANQHIYANKVMYHNGLLWVATVNYGIAAWDGERMAHHYHATNGLTGNYVRTFAMYGDTLWVATDKGLNRIEITSGKISVINKEDGLAVKEINAITVTNGKIFLATNKGLFTLPSSIHSINPVPPGLTIQSISSRNRRFGKQDSVILHHGEADITVEYGAYALRSRKNFICSYRLLGYDSVWTTVQHNERKIQYNSLPSGNYILEIKAANEDGIETNVPIKIYIQVQKPYWLTWWFITGMMVCIGLCIYIAIRQRIRYIQRKAGTREKMVRSQLTALKAQMNPHFMYNTLNSIQDLILSNDIRQSNTYLSKFSTLMRKVLVASNHNNISVADEIEILQLYLELEKLRFGAEFSFSITTSRQLQIHQINIPTLILQPFVENAIKHGLLHKKGDKKLTIKFENDDQVLRVIIEDNGVGRKKSAEINERRQKNTSFSTGATLQRLELLNSISKEKITCDIEDLYDHADASGTRVTIKIIPA